MLTREQQHDLLGRGYSRRHFARIASLLGAGAALPFYTEASLAQLSYVRGASEGDVLLNANENPLGPAPEAADAMRAIVAHGGRYLQGVTIEFGRTLAESEGLSPDRVMVSAGSSDPLARVVVAFSGPQRPYVFANPGYEAGGGAARFIGARAIGVPLRADYAHDVKAMAAAAANAGVIYVCNPNNPTGTMTPAADIDWIVEHKPAGSVILLDEAYIHFTREFAAGQSGMRFVKQDKDVIVLRTFSKIYGMAGLRAGAAFGRPDLIAKIRGYGGGFMPVTAMAGGTASLRSKTLVAERAAYARRIREDVLEWLDKKDYKATPSVDNKFMVNVRRPAREVVSALAERRVFIGRVWPAWPTWCRVTVGTKEEMEKFKQAFAAVMA